MGCADGIMFHFKGWGMSAPPTRREKNNLPIDVRYAYNEMVEIHQLTINYEQGNISEDEYVREVRSIKDKYLKLSL